MFGRVEGQYTTHGWLGSIIYIYHNWNTMILFIEIDLFLSLLESHNMVLIFVMVYDYCDDYSLNL